MLVAQYSHRLTADFDMQRIRDRCAERGPDFDTVPGLVFKTFTVRERGRHGAAGNVYSLFYLWRDAAALADFLEGARFRGVIDTFGRPPVETWLPIATEIGDIGQARFVHKQVEDIEADLGLAELRSREIERARARVLKSGAGVSIAALDTATWRLARFELLAEPPADAGGTAYEIAYLARPGVPDPS